MRTRGEYGRDEDQIGFYFACQRSLAPIMYGNCPQARRPTGGRAMRAIRAPLHSNRRSVGKDENMAVPSGHSLDLTEQGAPLAFGQLVMAKDDA